MKFPTLLSLIMFLLSGVVVSACGKEEDMAVQAQNHKLKKIEYLDEVYHTPKSYYRTWQTDFAFNDKGELTKVDEYNVETNTFSVNWGYGNAIVDEGRIAQIHYRSWSADLKYNSNGNLKEIECDRTRYIATWEGQNISKISRVKKDGQIVEWTEYSYTNYQAGMLSYYVFFNPFCEFDFLDTTGESAVFFTGLCGPLSRNLPKEVRRWSKYGQDGKGLEDVNAVLTMTYSYQMNSLGLPAHVTIEGKDFFDSAEKKIDMDITWEE